MRKLSNNTTYTHKPVLTVRKLEKYIVKFQQNNNLKMLNFELDRKQYTNRKLKARHISMYVFCHCLDIEIFVVRSDQEFFCHYYAKI